ncbi:hypothetical protein [Nonomuraea typhae]|uniref:Secreted protein n=1 Tax=Nonomuraea typhae TaxID=2603600 RepID=A0ABW7Z9L6_9ACTN
MTRTLLGAATAAIVALSAFGPAAHASSATAAQAPSFLFQYTFNNHLKVAGGNFTVGGRVFLTVKFNTGRVAFSKWETARTHAITPGGAIYVETTIAAPCNGGPNGYARAYDKVTARWSPRLPVTICQRID